MLLSLDVGFNNMGYSVFDSGKILDCGVIVTKKSANKSARTADDRAVRSAQIAAGLRKLVDEYQCEGIVGELPSGGAQSAKAMAMMGMATAIVASVSALLDVPCEWTTPNEVKIAVIGKSKATKDEVMDAVAEQMGWERKAKTVRRKVPKKKGGKGNGNGAGEYVEMEQVQYTVLGRKMGKGEFEHVADSVGAYWALKQGGVLVKMCG